MNLFDLFSIVMDSITLNFFKINNVIAGRINVVPNIMARHTSALTNETSQIPVTMNIRNIHVGNNIG